MTTPTPLRDAEDATIRAYPRIYGMAVTIAVITVLGLVGVFGFAERERGRALAEWQSKLNLVADTRAQALQGWLSGQWSALGGVSENASVQLYLMDLAGAKGDPAQKDYLRNLLTLTAERMGMEAAPNDAVPANVNRVGVSGLALLDAKGQMIAATRGMPQLEGPLAERLATLPKAEKSLLDMQLTPTGEVQLGFAVPIFSVQGDQDASSQVGSVVALRTLDEGFYRMLAAPGGESAVPAEVTLVRVEGDNVLYLTPLADNTAPLLKRLSSDAARLDAAFAVSQPGGFAERRDYRDQPVLVTGRAVEGTPWTLVTSVNRKLALAESEAWRSSLIVTLLLAILVVVVTIVAVWRHASSKKAYDMSVKATKLAARSAAQEKLLRLVTDNQPDPVFIVDQSSKFWFANQKTAEVAGVGAEDILGKTMAQVLGPDRAKSYLEANEMAMDSGRPYSQVKRVDIDSNKPRVVLSEHIPLSHIPVDQLPLPTPGVLVVEQDITDAVNERERRLKVMNEVVETLITLVDRRDPFAAYHSLNVSRVAREIAIDMGLDTVTIETTEIAGKLMNIGKIVVPSEVLTKTSALDDREKQSIRESLVVSSDLLTHIHFDGPVVETLKQSQEAYDGTGPLKLKGEEILLSARIIGVANSFIGMISPRSYRKAITIDAATKILLEEMDKKFDRRVVVALINYLDNHNGREIMSELTRAAEKKPVA